MYPYIYQHPVTNQHALIRPENMAWPWIDIFFTLNTFMKIMLFDFFGWRVETKTLMITKRCFDLSPILGNRNANELYIIA